MPVTLQILPVFGPDGKPHGLAPKRRIDADLLAAMKPGPYKAKITKLRSQKAHNLYFKAIEVAAEQWPSNLEPEPKGDAELLRAWLQCTAGPKWRKSLDFPPETHELIVTLIQEIRGEGRYAFVDPVVTTKGPKLRCTIPLSIAHDAMDEDEFAPLREGVFEIIELTFGKTVNDLVAEAQMAA